MGADTTPVRGTGGPAAGPEAGRETGPAPAAAGDPADRYPALPAQRGMILNSLRHPEAGIDVLQFVFRWAEPIRPGPFEAAWRGALRRHPILRTGFELSGDDGLVQTVHPAPDLDLRWLSLAPAPADGPDLPLAEFLAADRLVGLDTARAPLFRIAVLRRGAAESAPAYEAVVTMHHAIIEGRSLRMLMEEISHEYAEACAGRTAEFPARPRFADYVRWRAAVDETADEAFWRDHLTGTVLPRPLPGYLGGPWSGPSSPQTAVTTLTRAESDAVRATAAAAGLSSATMITAAWALLRAMYGGVRDVVVAVTRSCRYGSIPDADEVLGVLINTVPLRVRFDGAWSVRDLLVAVHQGSRRLRDHQLSSMASILESAGVPVDGGLVDSLVAVERTRLIAELAGRPGAPADARIVRLPSYPLTVMAFDEPEIELSLVWDGRRIAAGTPERMLAQLRSTLIEFAQTPGSPLAALSLGADEEAATMPDRDYPRDATIGAQFTAQVARDPAAVALVAGDREWSYAELDRWSNGLAWELRRRGVRTDAQVVVALPRGPEFIAVALAVLKAGGAYLPIDPASPAARVAGMVGGARFAVLAGPAGDTAAGAGAGLPLAAGTDVLRIDQWPADGTAGADTAPPDLAHPLSLAYLNFTSGSTGIPKGVAVPHRAVLRLVSDPVFVTLGPGERVLHLAPAAFDASTLEIWGALLTGAAVVVAPPGPLGLAEIAGVLRGTGVTVAWLTSGLFHQLVETDPGALAGVRQLLTGGDVLDPDAVRAALAARAGRPLVNGYGPTENTTFTTCHVMTAEEHVGATVSIGRPIQHTTVHLLDEQHRPVPVGVPGELYAGGDGLARGYAGNATLTARSFVPDPDVPGGRLYRTGDLARRLADGTIEFLGRVDDQLKIRGFRVEPGEVETALRTHPGVRQAVVVVRGTGARRHLVGYVTPAAGTDPATLRPTALADHLAQRLPDYLIPAAFAALPEFPLTANGKVDRAALPDPDAEPAGTAPVRPPRAGVEQRLAAIWSVLLPGETRRPETIDREASFFALGGNSLTAARLMFRLREEFGAELSLGAFYEAPTLAACAAAVPGGLPGGGTSRIGRRSREGYRVPPAATGSATTAEVDAGSEPRPPATPGAATGPIGRRARADHQVPAAADRIGRRPRADHRLPAAPAEPPEPSHLIPLTDSWSLWRTVCLRSAGLPLHHLEALGAPALAAAVDQGTETPDDFPAAVRELSAALHTAAGLPLLREAVAWQNRHALTTGIDSLRRRDPATAARNTKHRQHEALVASYLQRYCAKNDTIGFFGPVSWATLDDEPGIRIAHRPGPGVAVRATYLEGWGVRAIMADRVSGLRPWLVPRLLPFLGLDGTRLRLPLAPAVELAAAEAAVLRACDGIRTATEVAEFVVADGAAGLCGTDEVFAALAALADQRRLAWQVDLAPQDVRPERTLAAVLSRVPDPAVRIPAEAALAELTAARDRLAAAAGDPERVAEAMADLEQTFTGLAAVPATRRAGELYAGRTLAYEECLRTDTVQLGADALDGIRAALGLVLDSARWFTAACAGLWTEHFEALHRTRAAALGSPDTVPFADFWLLANDALFDRPSPLTDPAVRELQARWAGLVGLADPGGEPTAGNRVQLSAAGLRDRAAVAFPRTVRPWPAAVHHSPDLMIAGPGAATGGPVTWVLGELHPSVVTSRYATWLAFHDDPAAVRAGMRADLGGPAVFVAETAEDGGVCSRLSNVLASPGDRRLVFAHDSSGYDPAEILPVGECDVVRTGEGLRVRRRGGGFDLPLLEVVSDLLAAAVANSFRPLPAAAHAPRVTLDDLVISRESWTFPAAGLAFADLRDEHERYVRARGWAVAHGLPRYVFLRSTGEAKPIYADLTSLASIDLLCRALRRSRRTAGDAATVTVVEMLPAPHDAWLTDADGRRYSAELRMVAVDRNQER